MSRKRKASKVCCARICIKEDEDNHAIIRSSLGHHQIYIRSNDEKFNKSKDQYSSSLSAYFGAGWRSGFSPRSVRSSRSS